MSVLSYPYESVVAPLAPSIVVGLGVFGVASLALSWVSPRAEQRAPLTILVLVGLSLLIARARLDVGSAAYVGLVWLAHAIALYGLARYDWPAAVQEERVQPLWTGLAIIAVAFACKCVALDQFPRILNAYSAWTGLDGIRALEGNWPPQFFQGKEYDLMNGGHSPLQLPLLWCCMQIFGGTRFAVRFAEVIGSTLLLTFLWLWLRQSVRGGWGLLALAVFAFSPWHLAQSRAGTFLSISTALSMMLLWIATRLSRLSAGWGWWLSFGIGAGLIGYAYAPVKVLYAFFFLVVALCGYSAWRHGEQGWWRGPSLAVGTFFVFLAIQLWHPERFGQMFRSDFGILATDTSIWHKTAQDEVTAATQPPRVILENLFRNAREWMRLAYAEPTILSWYAPALSLGALIAMIALARSREWVAPLYFLIGMLPPLIIFPLLRRALIIWPLVYVVGVVFARELVRRSGALLPSRGWRVACRAVVLTGLIAASANGLHLFASTNSIVSMGTYFGGDHVWRMVRKAEPLLPSHHVYFVNLNHQLMPIVELELFERGRALGRRHAWEYLNVDEENVDLGNLVEGQPLAFFYLVQDEQGNDAILDKIVALLPGGELTSYIDDDGNDILLYSVYRYDRGI